MEKIGHDGMATPAMSHRFNLKLSSQDLRALVQDYLDGKDKENALPCIVQWSKGEYFCV